ncbi:MAG: hypothetical protein AB1726_14280 [Planctomycetota bacterium]
MRLWIAAVFLALAGWFAVEGVPASLPADLGGTIADPVPRAALDPRPLREPVRDPPTTVIATLRQRCTDCHDLFESRPETERPPVQHREIVLDHGLNARCFNCHARADHKSLLDGIGALIPYADSDRSCARCHGPTWQDWRRGMHGRTGGAWESASGAQVHLTCVQCHDPHSPAFPPMAPLPGPRTLRMGDPGERGAGSSPAAPRNPLEPAPASGSGE